MAMHITSSPFDRTLFVLVACTMDESRLKALDECVTSIVSEREKTGFAANLLVVDNGSRFKDPLMRLKGSANVALLSKNLGYWGALNWATKNVEDLFKRTFEFIHPIESDLIFYKTGNLKTAINYLAQEQRAATVRTQEFIVQKKGRFFKNSRAIFPCKRSRVAPYNGVTNAAVKIEPSKYDKLIYETNWHSKVPALHKWDEFRSCITELADIVEFTELDFMRIMSKENQMVALLNGGIYYSPLSVPRIGTLTGSYSSPKELERLGYRKTRKDRIDTEDFEVEFI